MPDTYPRIHITGAIHHWVRTRESLRAGQDPVYLGTAEISPQLRVFQHYSDSPFPVAGQTLPYQRKDDGQSASIAVLLTRFSKFAVARLLERNAFKPRGQTGMPEPAPAPPVANPGEDKPVPVGDTPDFLGTLIGPPPVAATKDPIIDSGTIWGAAVPKPPPRAVRGPALASTQPERDPYLESTIPTGQESRWSRGQYAFGNRDFELWQVFEYALFKHTITPGLEIGWYWPQVLLNEATVVEAGTQAEKQLVVVEAHPLYIDPHFARASSLSTSLGTSPGYHPPNMFPQFEFDPPPSPKQSERGWVLYSQDRRYFPPSLRIPQ